MAKTGAERVAAHRQRQADLIAALRGLVAELEARLARSDAARAMLERENAGLSAMLAERDPGAEKDDGCSQGQHPAQSVEDGTCRLCGDEVWQ